MRNLIRSGIGAALAAVLAAGCGGSSKNTGSFVGTWMYSAATITTNCPGSMPSTDPLTGTEAVTAGSTSDLVMTGSLFGPACPVRLSISGTTASAVPGQMCMETDMSGTAMLSITNYSFVTTDGKAAHGSGTGSVNLNSMGMSLVCSSTFLGDLTKL